MRLIIYSITIFLCFSCSDNKNTCTNFPVESDIFFTYLSTHFELKNIAGKKYFFIIPTNACGGCAKVFSNIFQAKQPNEKYYMILSKNNIENIQYIKSSQILIDSKSEIDRINLNIQNTTLIITNGYCIQEILPLSPQNIDSVEYFLKSR